MKAGKHIRRGLIVLLLIGVGLMVISIARKIDRESKAERENEQAWDVCHGHMRLLVDAFRNYAEDHHGLLPPAATWADAIYPYIRTSGQSWSVFHCPSDPSKQRCSYALNRRLGGRKLSALKGEGSDLVILYETTSPGRNPSGNGEDVCSPGRHYGMFNPNPGIHLATPENLSFVDWYWLADSRIVYKTASEARSQLHW